MKKFFKLNNQGFSHLEIGLVVVVFLLLGVAGYAVYKNTSHAGSTCSGQTFSTADVSKSLRCVKDVQNLVYGFAGEKIATDGYYGKNTQDAVNAVRSLFKIGSGSADAKFWNKVCNSLPTIDNADVKAAQTDACGKAIMPMTAAEKYWDQYSSKYTHLTMDTSSSDNQNYPSSHQSNFHAVACKVTHADKLSWSVNVYVLSDNGNKGLGTVNLNGYWTRNNGGTDSPKTNYTQNWTYNVGSNTINVPHQTYQTYPTINGRYVSPVTHDMQARDVNVWVQIEMPNLNYGTHDNTKAVKLSELVDC